MHRGPDRTDVENDIPTEVQRRVTRSSTRSALESRVTMDSEHDNDDTISDEDQGPDETDIENYMLQLQSRGSSSGSQSASDFPVGFVQPPHKRLTWKSSAQARAPFPYLRKDYYDFISDRDLASIRSQSVEEEEVSTWAGWRVSWLKAYRELQATISPDWLHEDYGTVVWHRLSTCKIKPWEKAQKMSQPAGREYLDPFQIASAPALPLRPTDRDYVRMTVPLALFAWTEHYFLSLELHHDRCCVVSNQYSILLTSTERALYKTFWFFVESLGQFITMVWSRWTTTQATIDAISCFVCRAHETVVVQGSAPDRHVP